MTHYPRAKIRSGVEVSLLSISTFVRIGVYPLLNTLRCASFGSVLQADLFFMATAFHSCKAQLSKAHFTQVSRVFGSVLFAKFANLL